MRVYYLPCRPTKEQGTAKQTDDRKKQRTTHLQRQRPAAPAHGPAPGEGALVVVQGAGARRVAAVVVGAAAVVAGG